MSPTPLYDALRAFADTQPLRFHMPGHKGGDMPLSELNDAAALDFTELPPTGDLFAGEGALMESQDLWAKVFGMDQCLFLTGGSTQGVLSALTLAAGDGGTVLLDRGSHRSAYHALALLNLNPIYLDRPWLEAAGVLGPISPQRVDYLLKTHPDINTVCITSPTYYGVLSDIPAISTVVHYYGGTLVVDAAHGTHLPFLGNRDLSAADLVVTSAHKTLPALGQSALLFAGESSRFTHAQLRRAGSLYGSASPSYVLMASLDGARAWMEGAGLASYRAAMRETARLRQRFPSLTQEDAPLDPGRYVLKVTDGLQVKKALERQGIYPEMADRGHVVFILTCADGCGQISRLEKALSELDLSCPESFSPLGPPPTPKIVLSPRRAYFSLGEFLPLRATVGQVSATQVAPYPPGVPIIAPGELICKKHLAYLAAIGYNMEETVQVVAKEGYL